MKKGMKLSDQWNRVNNRVMDIPLYSLSMSHNLMEMKTWPKDRLNSLE